MSGASSSPIRARKARRRLTVVGLALAALMIVSGQANAAVAPLPNSMASIGDSISRATDVCCSYGDHPTNSWTTGSSGSDGISSHYERILAANPAISGRNFSDAVSGAKMSDAPAQANLAVSQGAEYVTVLMGANDACTATVPTMTSVESFRANFTTTLQTLTSGTAVTKQVFVSSIPDVYKLWQLYRSDFFAQVVWGSAKICQSLLAPSRSSAERLAVQQRVKDYNTALASVCSANPKCRYDGGAVFDYSFTKAEVSKLDYFHPSLAGQAKLASLTWARSQFVV